MQKVYKLIAALQTYLDGTLGITQRLGTYIPVGGRGVPVMYYMYITIFFNMFSTVSYMRPTTNSQAHVTHGGSAASMQRVAGCSTVAWC